jgi:ABC-type bacteriocin/lantibiotic exporter with double-glycine peptidase domain
MLLKLNGVIMTGIALAGNILIYALAVKNAVDPSSYYAFSAAYGRLTGAFTVLACVAGSLAAIGPVMETAEPILQTEPEPMKGKVQVTRLNGQVEVNHVFFRYEADQAFVLNDLSLKIGRGEYVALVGKTGCGKSSLIRVLLGFERPEKGSVFFDGRDQGSLELTSLRRRIGVVMQNGRLFQGNIFDNISIAAPQMTMEEAWEAAEAAGIADEIREMPMGMHTLISENQGGISGGQKQRLLIARALAGKPDILILDEATSALDNQTQKEVAEILGRMKCTRIVIAHRLSTIRNCDRILVLDQGNIVEEGTYEELMGRKGFFAKLVARQQLE